MNNEFYMNYAEGQGAPTVKYNNKDMAEKEATRLADKLGVQVITLKAVTAVEPKDITKRVKSYADACAVLGIEPVNEEVDKIRSLSPEIITRRPRLHDIHRGCLNTVKEWLNDL